MKVSGVCYGLECNDQARLIEVAFLFGCVDANEGSMSKW